MTNDNNQVVCFVGDLELRVGFYGAPEAEYHHYKNAKIYVDGKETYITRKGLNLLFQEMGYGHVESTKLTTLPSRMDILGDNLEMVAGSPISDVVFAQPSYITPYHEVCSPYSY